MIGAIIGGIGLGLGYLAQRKQDEKARAESERNRQFQERMSSTAVQRSVDDLRAAGLNPALAYERSASTPGGSTASFDNSAINAGISNATRYAELLQTRRIERETHEANMTLMREQAGAAKATNAKNTADAELANGQLALARQALQFNFAQQPALLRQATAQSILTELGIPAARNAASFEEFLGGSTAAQALRNKDNILPALMRGLQHFAPTPPAAAKKLWEKLK